MATSLDGMKLKLFERKYGPMTSKQAFQLAIEAEQTAKDCGPMDVATPHFIQQQIDFEKYAALLENAGL